MTTTFIVTYWNETDFEPDYEKNVSYVVETVKPLNKYFKQDSAISTQKHKPLKLIEHFLVSNISSTESNAQIHMGKSSTSYLLFENLIK